MGDSRSFLADSLRMSGGLLIWGLHLGVVYGWAALVCARGWADRRWLGLGPIDLGTAAATVAALAASAWLVAAGRRERRGDATESGRFAGAVTVAVAGFALLAVAWTALVAVVVQPPCSGEPRVETGDERTAAAAATAAPPP